MTNKKFWPGMLVVVLTFGMTVVGCDNDPTDEPSGPPSPIKLTVDVWADGNITAPDGEQWFKFTAAAVEQNIYVNFGTLTNLYVQLYDRSGENTVGSEVNLYGSTNSTSQTLTVGQEYLIKIRPYSSSYRGTYKISFTMSAQAPAITLTANVWADGNITTPDGEQWFKFTATAATQYIHVSIGTLNDLNIQLYDNSRNDKVGSQSNLPSLFADYVSRTLTVGQVYYIKVWPYSSYSSRNSGTYQIAFNTSPTAPLVKLPSNAIQLTANVWADGNIPTSADVQWFKFTATAAAQYIHAGFGTLTRLDIQLYDNTGKTVGYQTTFDSYLKFTLRPLTAGQVYYIKVWSYSTSYSGTYQIAFNTSTTAPLVTLPSNAIQLTAGVWADGNIPTSADAQWFKFTATVETQYIHASFGTLTGLSVQLYDSSSNTVGNQTNFSGSTKYASRTLTVDQEYYIKVLPYSSSDSGTYQIAFNTSTAAPLPTNAIQLAANIWADGDIPTSGGEQWFKFTATAATQYIHASFGTLDAYDGLYIQLYDSGGNTVASRTYLDNSSKYINWSLTEGQEYYMKVWPYSSSDSGTYKIAFNTSTTAPPVKLPTTATQLTVNVWTDGNIPTSNGEQWFKFTATVSTQYIHADFGTLEDLYVQVYNSDGNTVGNETRLDTYTKYISRTLTVEQEYYIKVRPHSSTGSGTYQVLFNTSSALPVTPPSSNVTQLTVNVWADGNIPTSSGEQWFKFTASAATQYIHVSLGTLNDLYVNVYDSDGIAVGSQTNLFSSTKYASRTLTAGQEFYIKVRPYDSSKSGTYKIAFNTSTAAPLPTNAIQLTVNVWADGDIPASGGEQWFKFTATAATQYIHVSFGTLDDLYVNVYNSDGIAVGSETNLFSSNKYINRTLTAGQEYHIKVWPFSTLISGTYKIAFNTTTTAPSP
jgi:hypothetical protein